MLDAIRRAGAKPGLVLNPETSIAAAAPWLSRIDMLLIMSVWPGFGEEFIAQVLETVKAARKLAPELDIEIDGGINAETA